jgi:hypothetical protein
MSPAGLEFAFDGAGAALIGRLGELGQKLIVGFRRFGRRPIRPRGLILRRLSRPTIRRPLGRDFAEPARRKQLQIRHLLLRRNLMRVYGSSIRRGW